MGTSPLSDAARRVAILQTIRADLARHDPVTAVYARHAEALDVSYERFCRLIAPLVSEATIIPKLTPVAQAPVRPRPAAPHDAEAEIEALVDLLLARGAR